MMFPKRHDLTYFNTLALWFAGVITRVYGPCKLCPNDPEHQEGPWTTEKGQWVMPQGPYYKVLIQANGYSYVATVMEYDRGLGGWLVLEVNGESRQLQQALEWTFYQGPPHLVAPAHRLYGQGDSPWNNAQAVPPWNDGTDPLGRKRRDNQGPVSVMDATGYGGA
jgi:hypothetical protein